MAKWTIYSKNGETRCECVVDYTPDKNRPVKQDTLEYSGKWMGECFLTVSIKSPYPIDFQIGDYITYRGEKFTINYDPTVIKKARRGTYGEGFTYDSIKFNSLSNELTEIRFHDWVLNDNKYHYTSLPNFSFYCKDVDDLVDRLQANTNRYCKDNGFKKEDYWMFYTLRNNTNGTADRGQSQTTYERTVERAQSISTDSTFVAKIKAQWEKTYGTGDSYKDSRDDERFDRNITASSQSVWDMMTAIKQQFGLNFIIRGRNVYVGTAGVPTSHLFEYGKNKGLYEVDKTADTDQEVVTKLHAYGSDENLPTRYYADLGKQVGCKIKKIIQNTQDNDDPKLVFNTDLPFSSRYFYDVLESSVNADKQLYKVAIKLSSATVNGYVYADVDGNTEFMANKETEPNEANLKALMQEVAADAIIYFMNGVRANTFSSSYTYYIPTNLPDNMAVNNLMLPGFPNNSLADLCKAEYDSKTNVTTYYIRKDKNSEYIAFHTESGNHVVSFSDDKYNPYILSPNASELGIKEGDIFCNEENDDNGLKKVYPTIEEVTDIDAGTGSTGSRLDAVVKADKIEDNGVYPNDKTDNIKGFNIYIPDLGFDLKKAAEDAGGSDMKISMKNGYNGGRTFDVANVSKQKDGTWKLECKRTPDNDLDLYFPYSYAASVSNVSPEMTDAYQILPGDNYVLTGIAVSDVNYVWAASVKLLRKAIHWLCKNDYTRYVYNPKIDEIYMARQDKEAKANGGISLHDTLKEGDMLLFADDDLQLNGAVYIDQLNIKENGNNGIPTYDVTLRNEIQVGTIQRIQNQVDSIKTDISNGNVGGNGGVSPTDVESLIRAYGGRYYLSKLNEDTAQRMITFLQGTQIGQRFVSGLLGEGGIFQVDADGKTYIEADRLYIRMKAYFDTVEYRKVQNSGGNRIASPAGGKIIRVEALDSDGKVTTDSSKVATYRCYFRAKDSDENEVKNEFAVGDQAFCQVTNVRNGSLEQHRFWRLVTGRNEEGTLTDNDEYWIDLSATDCEEGSDVPQAQDSVSTLGNRTDSTRQGAIIEYSTGDNAPSYQIYQNINSYSLKEKNYVDLGYNSGTGRAYLNVYGDAYIGDKDGSTYVKYDAGKKKLTVKAAIEATSTIDGKDIKKYIQDNSTDWSEEQINDLINTATGDKFDSIDKSIAEVKKQADGAIETWYYKGKPTLSNVPAKDWTTNEIKDTHLGDLYYDHDTGFAYRFLKDDNGTYEWQLIQDSSISAAMKAADEAQHTADGKRRIFVVQPKPPYDEGDLWVNATYNDGTVSYSNDILKCTTSRQSGDFVISDWGLASKYTDDTALDQFKLNDYVQKLTNGTISKDITNAQTSATNALTNAATAQKSADNAQSAANAADKKGQQGINDAAAAQQKADSAYELAEPAKQAADAYNAKKTAYDAVLQALGGGTVVDGGLVLTSLIGLKDGKGKTWSGISGTYNANAKGGGIAAWYGGGMVDHEAASTLSDYAKSLFRFDGSGYIASGNITWDANGKVNIKEFYFGDEKIDASNLKDLIDMFHYTVVNSVAYIKPKAPFSELYIGGNGANNRVVTIADLTSQIGGYTWWGQKANGKNITGSINVGTADGTYVQIGAIRLVYDANNNAIKVVKSDGNAANFYATGGVSALGMSSVSTSGDGGAMALSDLVDASISSPANNQVLSYDSKQSKWVNKTIVTDGISSVTVNGSGNAVTDVAKNGTGLTVTKGATFLTQHQDYPTGFSVRRTDVHWGQNPLSTKVLITDWKTAGGGEITFFDGKDSNGYSDGSLNIQIDGTIYINEGKEEVATQSWVNNKGYVTSSVVNGYATEIWVKNQKYLTQHQSLSNYVTINSSQVITGEKTFTKAISYQGSKSTYPMIKWIDNTQDSSGNGIKIGGGGAVVIGGGESADAVASSVITSGGDERLLLCNDADIDFYTNCQNGFSSAKHVSIDVNGNFTGNAKSSTKLQTPRTLSLSGDASGSVSFDGSANVTLNTSVNSVKDVGDGRTLTFEYSKDGFTSNPQYLAAWMGNKLTYVDNSLVNVNSATKLQTARTLWGQSFDGTGNVSGDLTNVGIIQGTYAIATNYIDVWKDDNGNSHPWYGLDHRYANTGVNSTTLVDFFGLSLRTYYGLLSMDRMGNVGIGTTSPAYKLDVNGGGHINYLWVDDYVAAGGALGAQSLELDFSTPFIDFHYNNSSSDYTSRIIENANGVLTMECSVIVTNGLQSNSYVTALSSSSSSDIRLKDVISDTALKVSDIANAPSVRFTWKNDKNGMGVMAGSIAQYWQKVLPEVVRANSDGYLTLQYGVTALLASISIAKKVEEHERAINKLKKEMENLKKG